MKRIIYGMAKFLFFFGCFFSLFTGYVQAYVDPSTVTYVIQAVAGVLIALGAAFTIFRHKIFAFFKKNKKADKSEDTPIEFKNIDD